MKKYLDRIKNHKLFPVIEFFIVLAVCVIQYLSVEISVHNFVSIVQIKFLYKLIGVATIIFLNILLIFIFKKVRRALNISNLITAVLSIANFYVYKFHGVPFNIDLLKNVGTALNVLSSYTFDITLPVVCAVIAAVVQFILVKIFLDDIKCERKVSAISAAVLVIFMVFSYNIKTPLIDRSAVGWSWTGSINRLGYVPCLVQSTNMYFNIVQQPKGYDEETVKENIKNIEVNGDNTATPDIILILNETLYDLNKITDTGVESFEYINSLENAVRGYAVCPAVGGGTNKSEYELLTSNTLGIAPNVTPFNTFNLDNINSITRHLKDMGYTTFAAHPSSPSNYNREKSYPKLCFDNVYFDKEFSNFEYYANRSFYPTDESVYKNMIRWYEEMDSAPRFAYMLTIQNHGDYQFNTPNQSLVKINRDYGENTEKVAEFMSCMKLSDMAFKMLVDYYSNVDRDVIICMVGDHAPSFAVEVADKTSDEEQMDILLRSVPYIIWSNNIDLTEFKQNSNTIGMVNLVPKMLNAAGVKMSPFYSYMENLNENVPILTSFGKYVTANGDIYNYNDDAEYTDKVNMYLDFCYANMKHKDFMMYVNE